MIMKKTETTVTPKFHQWARFFIAAAILTVIAAFVIPARAQTVNFTFRQTRTTVPVSFSGQAFLSNNVPYTTNGLAPDGNGNLVIQPISINITGLPSGVTSYSLTNLGNTPSTPFTATSLRTNANNTLHLGIYLNLDGSTPEGTYPLTFTATGGATNTFIFFLDVAHIWNWSTNAAADGAGNWSDSTKWLGGSAPGANANVIFNDLGGQTNSLTGTNLLIDSIVDSDVTIGSLRFAQTNFNNTGWHNLQIAAGKTLTITGTNGFSQLRDIVDETFGLTDRQGVTISGTNNATLVISNRSANVSSLIDNTVSTLDLSQLDNFMATVNVLGMGDPYLCSPNFLNYLNNGYAGLPRKFVPNFNLARTNVIKASFVDPYNYTNAADREYGISLVSTLTGNSSQSTVPIINLGISNTFYADGILAGGAAQRPQVQFNPSFRASNCFALFRGTNGGRMTTFAEADAAGPGSTRGNIKAVVDFSGGTIDMLVDQFYVGRDRPQIESGQNPNYQGFFTIGKGIVDANTAFFGYRQYAGAATNNWAPYAGYCEGKLTIVSNGTFIVHGAMTLGYTTETNIQGLGGLGATDSSAGNTEYGQVYVLNGGSLVANQINVGGPAVYCSSNNFIIVSNNASLTISNSIAGPQQSLTYIQFWNGSTLNLNINGANSNAVIYANVFNLVGSNSLVIASIRNLSSLTIPLFKWVTGSTPSSFTLINQTPYNVQTVISANEIDLQVITGAPKNLIWKGYSSSVWDDSTFNWLDTATGLHTNFSIGDNVTFDDTASAFNVSIANTPNLLPGSIIMTNSSNDYTFNNGGGGSILGGSTLSKTGTGLLEFDCPSTINIQLNQGKLTGFGSVGSANIASGAIMDFSGNMGGSITCAGIVTLESGATAVGSMTLQSGGVATNLGVINGSFAVGNGSLLVNGLGGQFPTFGSSTISSNAIVINRGQLGLNDQSAGGQNLTVNGGGTFEDTGEGSITMNGTLTVGSGAIFIPGGDGIGTTTVLQGPGGGSFPARVLLSQGSTNIFKVNNDNSTYTKLGCKYLSLGANSSASTYNGATIKMVNVGVAPYAAGQSFAIFVNSDENDSGSPFNAGLNTTNSYPVIDPLAPASGLAWNINGITLNGTVSIVGVATNPFTLGFMPRVAYGVVSITGYTTNTMTSIVTTNFSTNNYIFSELSWPATNIGWRLQQQQTTLTSGLGTNWIDVFGAPWTNDFIITNNIMNGNAGFFRMIYP
jgi:hypothetical protein